MASVVLSCVGTVNLGFRVVFLLVNSSWNFFLMWVCLERKFVVLFGWFL